MITIQALLTFGGVKRRFSESFYDNQILIDDYAHHPREINATIESARKKYPENEVVAVFKYCNNFIFRIFFSS